MQVHTQGAATVTRDNKKMIDEVSFEFSFNFAVVNGSRVCNVAVLLEAAESRAIDIDGTR
jgi:hypothetical protein